MHKPSYKLSISSTTIDSKDPASGRLVSLSIEKSMDTPADIFEMILGVPCDLNLRKKDSASIELGYEDNLEKNFEGIIDRIIPSITHVAINGISPFSSLLALRKDTTRLNQKSGDIIKYLSGEAGIGTAKIEDGFELPYYVVDSRKNAYEHCLGLAKRNGFDLYCDEEGKLVFRKFNKTNADHTFTYAKNILYVQVISSDPIYEGAVVFGESPAGSKGKDAWCWFIKDFTPNSGSEGKKEKSVLIQDATIRIKEAATAYAKAKTDILRKKSVFGFATVPGYPQIRLGDAVEFKECPQDELNQLFQVRRVRHMLNKNIGFITEIGFCGT